MQPDDHVCLCFRVSQRKIVNYCRREKPAVPSLISECLGAGTGCGWCVPFIKVLHQQVEAQREDADAPEPGLAFKPAEYAKQRASYRSTGRRDGDSLD